MAKLVRRRPSPAMVVACIALIAAVGGPAIADQAVDVAKRAKLINGKKIKKRSIAGNRLRRNTLTGTEINESRLGPVPSANRATSATSATNAATAANAKNISDGLVTPSKFGVLPAARAFHSATQSIPNDTLTTVALNSEAFDTASLHSTTDANSRLTAPVSGIYSLTAAANWFVNPTGSRLAQIWQNGSTILVSDSVVPNQDDDHVLSTLARLSAGDYVELRVKQSSGGALLLATGPQGQTPLLTMNWVAPG
jgi:hypothetical protein